MTNLSRNTRFNWPNFFIFAILEIKDQPHSRRMCHIDVSSLGHLLARGDALPLVIEEAEIILFYHNSNFAVITAIKSHIMLNTSRITSGAFFF